LLDDSIFKLRVLDIYVFGFQGVYVLYMGILGVTLLFSLLIKRFDIDKEINTTYTLKGNAVKYTTGKIRGRRLMEI